MSRNVQEHVRLSFNLTVAQRGYGTNKDKGKTGIRDVMNSANSSKTISKVYTQM